MITELLGINLVDELGLSRLPADKRDALVAQMQDALENRINLRLLALLSEEDKKELDVILDTNQDMVPFLEQKIPNLNLVIAEIIANFKKEMLDLHALVQKHRVAAQ